MKKQRARRVMADFAKLKKIAQHYYRQEKWELALRTVFFACGFMYTMNQVQCDEELEELVENIAFRILPRSSWQPEEEMVTVYYDSFGSVRRGLTSIYLKALVHMGYRVKYISFQEKRRIEPDISALVGRDNVFWISGQDYAAQMVCLEEILAKSGAGTVFLCLKPDDVVAVGVFSRCPPKRKRCMINLTDHAFWLGRNLCDIVINFREFGSQICLTKRNLPASQTVYLPYYPDRTEDTGRQLPLCVNRNKLIFSGGALYKTQSHDNIYYKLLASILDNCSDVNFVYLGDGDGRKIKKLAQKYPERVFFFSERQDFFEIMKQCTLYLSTYPYNGGLMTQYALLAGKIPITLNHPGIEAELSIRHAETFWNYSSCEECLEEIKRLLTDDLYRRKQEEKLDRFLIEQTQFEKELQHILKHGCSLRKTEDKKVRFSGFLELPLENITGFKYCRLFFRKKGFYMIRLFPVKYLLGTLGAVKERLDNSVRKQNKR